MELDQVPKYNAVAVIATSDAAGGNQVIAYAAASLFELSEIFSPCWLRAGLYNLNQADCVSTATLSNCLAELRNCLANNIATCLTCLTIKSTELELHSPPGDFVYTTAAAI